MPDLEAELEPGAETLLRLRLRPKVPAPCGSGSTTLFQKRKLHLIDFNRTFLLFYFSPEDFTLGEKSSGFLKLSFDAQGN
jgi:hypothetical protein